jgi:hypothetical protein
MASEHVLELLCEFSRGNRSRVLPLILCKVNMAIPKAGGQGHPGGVYLFELLRDADPSVFAYVNNLAALDEHRAIGDELIYGDG